ncbi:MAG: hypothetical protein WC002_09915, partial [Candidatus Muiribacteriota bacterium]
MFKYRFCLLTILICFVFQTGIYAGVILDSITKYELGVRANSMGDAFTAGADDVTATLYNPAGLSLVDYTSVYFMHNNKFGDDIKNDIFIYSLPMKHSSLGISYVKESIGGIPVTDESLNIYDYQEASKSMFSVTYAKRLSKLQRIGVSFKYLTNDLIAFKGNGYGFDIGYQREINRKFTAGINLQDIMTSVTWDSGADDTVPMAIKTGIAYTSRKKDFRYGVDYVMEDKGDSYMTFGGEYKVSDAGVLRAGLKDGDMSIGFGVEYDNWVFDYAYIDTNAGESHVFSATMNIKKLFTAADREIQRARDGQVIRQARTVPQDRSGAYTGTVPASGPIKAVLDRHSQKFRSQDAEKVEEEIQMKREAIDIPEEATMHYRLGNTFVLEGIYSKAVEEYNKALAIQPRYSQARY